MGSLDPETARMLQDAVAKHVERNADGRATRAMRKQLPGHAPATLTTMADQGWIAVALPESAGGLGLGLCAAAIVAEGLAGTYSADPLHGLFMVGRLLMRCETMPDILPKLTAGDALPVVAWQERAQDFARPKPETIWAGDRLTGRKGWIVGAACASHFVVTAVSHAGTVLVLVPADAPGLSLTHDFRADGTPIGQLRLNAVPGTVLASGAEADSALRASLDETAVLIAAELMGHVDRMMALVVEHLKTRQQFGQPIGAFQALQHRASDMLIHQRLARAVLDKGLSRMDALDDPAARGAQTARLRARLNDTARLIMRESVQLFGAMGTTDENELSLHLKRCLSLIPWLGSNVEQRGYYMDLVAPEGRLAEGRM